MDHELPTMVASCLKDCALHRQVCRCFRSQELANSPTEAPANGYAFGKGIYLADCSSKSANYCTASLSGGTGLLLLVEAELSRPMYEISSGDYNAEEEAKKHNCIATKGVGSEIPLKWKDAGCIHDSLKGVQIVSSLLSFIAVID